MKHRNLLIWISLVALTLSACAAQPTQDPGFIFTVVAGTQTAAAWQTQRAHELSAKTPTQATLRPTYTAFPTATSFLYLATASSTPTPTATMTRTPRIRTEWPDWKTGEVVSMPKGSGENIGTNKRFSDLTGLMVIVVRKNGVVLRSAPNKAIGGPMEEVGAAFTLTGIMNRNPDFAWMFVQVIAANGKTYWVGGSENEDTEPKNCLEFYYPHLTASPAVVETPTLTPVVSIPYALATATESPVPSLTPLPSSAAP